MKELEDKYIELIINKCTNFENTKSILINYPKENRKFVKKLIQELMIRGIKDIALDEEDPEYLHKLLEQDEETIKNSPYLNNPVWTEYAKKNANFLMLKSEYPHYMDDLDMKKKELASQISLNNKAAFYEKQKINLVPWCILAIPSKAWAKEVFPNDKNAYSKLFKLIGAVCLLNEDNSAKAWDSLIANSNKIVNKLNKLKIKTLHYTNSLGTDFKVSLNKDALWCGIGQDTLCLVNMPSYEVFTSPDKNTAEGIIYSALPLYYHNQKVDKFYLKFKKGKVIDFKAKEGENVLKSIINSEKDMKFLGEVALVDKNSPIAKSKVIFGTTLLDENASCHIALGEGFPECLKNGEKLSDKKLMKKGLNIVKNHVDMMVGTDDLKITVETYHGKEIDIMIDGKFVI